MSNKPMKPAHNRHIKHGHDCPICFPPKQSDEWKNRSGEYDKDIVKTELKKVTPHRLMNNNRRK